MRKQILLVLLLASSCLSAQNLNVTLRSKITYPGQTLANVCGYTANGREYALVGAAYGMIIVDITNPDTPTQIVQIPGPNNLWKEIKTYRHYAFCVSEGGQGMQIIDLANLPSPNLNYRFYTGDRAAKGMLRIHALHVDTTKGFVYCFGGTKNNAYAFDLKPDPMNPHFAGKFNDLGYVHDGFADNDTLYAAHIYAGLFSIVDMSNKTHPKLINTQVTPGQFTHNTWLTDDHKTLLTTDEVNNSFLTAYDISDPTDIRFLDKIQSNPGSNSVVHNTHVRKNFAVTSWYKDGITIVDASRPGNLIQVGNFDTYADSGSGEDGCWGVYPFFPSGTIIASNITGAGTNDGELFILTPKYVRGCYLEGLVTNAVTGYPIPNVHIVIASTTVSDNTGATGRYAVGQVTPGLFTVNVSKTGYEPFQTEALLENGVLTALDVVLYPTGSLTVHGTVFQSDDVTPVPGATVWLYGASQQYSAISNGLGNYTISGVIPGLYMIAASEKDQGLASIYNFSLLADTTLNLSLIQFVHRESGLTNKLEVRPNPFSGQAEILYQSNGSNADVQVFNALGRFIETIRLDGDKNATSVGAQYPPGIYFIRYNEPNNLRQPLKFVKL